MIDSDPQDSLSPVNDGVESAERIGYQDLLRLLLDVEFYSSQLEPGEAATTDLVAHYLASGARRRLTPTPYFDPAYYLDQRAQLEAEPDLLLHYVTSGSSEHMSPHRLLLPGASLQPTPDGVDCVVGAVAPGLGPAEWRAECARVTATSALEVPATRFAGTDASDLIAMFDTAYYAEQLRRAGVSVPACRHLLHYLTDGWRAGFEPGPLFRTAFYVDAVGIAKLGDANPLVHFVTQGWRDGRSPHPLIDLAERDTTGGGNAVAAYLRLPASRRPALSPFFSARFYQAMRPEIDWSVEDPLIHYLRTGWRDGAVPNPAFDPVFYTRNFMDETSAASISPLEHFVLQAQPRPRTFAMFDGVYYLSQHADLSGWCQCPISHYLEYGVWEERRFTPLRVIDYLYNRFDTTSFAFYSPIGAYITSRPEALKRFIFIGHEGSRTGAPGIILKIVEQLAEYPGIECISIIDQPGPLVEDHARCSITMVPHHHRYNIYSGASQRDQLFRELDGLMDALADNPPLGVFCNSAESRVYTEYFKRRGLPVMLLMHEIAHFYPHESLEEIVRGSDRIIFPAEFVAEGMRSMFPALDDFYGVIPQGLLRERMFDVPRDRAIFAKHRVPVGDDDVVVLGCGTLDGRKGFDLYLAAARKVRERCGRNVKFVWVGGRPDWRIGEGGTWDTTAFWASWDMLALDLEDCLFVVNEVQDPEPFFAAADIFLLSSRADPFPCVVHEAMAAGLPIVGFENSGGAPEAFLPDAGLTAPYLDVAAMADRLIALVEDADRRGAMGAVGRRRIAERYRFDDYVARLMEQMAQLLPGHELPCALIPQAPSKGRIFFTVGVWSLSGVNTFTETLVNYLNDTGWDAEILLTRGRFGPKAKGDGGFYDREAEYLPKARFRFLQPAHAADFYSAEECVNSLRAFLQKQGRCILVPGFDYTIQAIFKDLPSGIQVLGVAHSDDIEAYDDIYRHGDVFGRIVAVSDEIKRNLGRQNPRFGDKAEVIRYGLVPPAPDDLSSAIAKRIGTAEPIRLIFAGRFEIFQKRIYDYVKLAQLLTRAKVDFELTLVGDGKEFATVRSRLGGLIHVGRVFTPGRLYHAETQALIQQAHVLLVLSDFEGLPLSLIEGLQNGCIPIVYEMKSGIPEIIVDGENGFVVGTGDVAAVVAHVVALQQDADLRARMIQAALATVEARSLTAAAMGRRYATIFEEMLECMNAGS